MVTRLARTPQTFLPLPAADFHVLMLLCDGPQHAYGLTQRSEIGTGTVRLGIGSLYRMLARLMEDGLIEEVPPKRGVSGNEAKRKYYRVTPLGRAVARAEAGRLRDVLEAAASRNLIRDPGVER